MYEQTLILLSSLSFLFFIIYIYIKYIYIYIYIYIDNDTSFLRSTRYYNIDIVALLIIDYDHYCELLIITIYHD